MSIRQSLLKVIADAKGATINDLMDATGMDRKRLHDNIKAAVDDQLLDRRKDDITGLPFYRITPLGQERLASGSGKPIKTTPAGRGANNAGSHASVSLVEESKHPAEGVAVVEQPKPDDAPVAACSDEMPTDKECCNAAKVVATTAGAEVAELRQTIEALQDDIRRQVRRADTAEQAKNAWQELAAEYECKSAPDLRVFIEAQSARIEALKAAIGNAKIQNDALNEQLMHGEEAITVTDAAKGYLVCAPKRKPMKLSKPESALAKATAAAKTTGRCEVFALVPVGVAVRKQVKAVEFQKAKVA